MRAIGFLEGVSFVLLLFVAMPLKYFAGAPEAVRIIGSAHGGLFLLYIVAAVHATVEYDWPWSRMAWLTLASLLPFGPFVADAKMLRRLPA